MTTNQPPSPAAGTEQEHHWFVYLLECADGTLYCGVTTDLGRRLQEHNGERPGGARYTRARRPVKLAASCPVQDRAQACRLEHAIRRLPSTRKLACLQEKAKENTSTS